MDEMVLLPAAGIEEEQTAPPLLAWLERADRGFFRSWFSTIGWAMVRPGQLMQSVPAASSLPEAWWFVILTHIPILLLAIGSLVIFPYAMGMSGVGFGFSIFALVVLAGTIVFVGLWGAVTHGMLCLLARPASGPRRTYQALCYSGGANVVSALPFVGFYLGWVWWLVSAVLMVKEGQHVSGWRAGLAVLLLPILIVLGIVGFYVWFFVFMLPQMGALTSVGTLAPTQTVLYAVLSYADDHQGDGPEHAAQLATQGYLELNELIRTDSYEAEDGLPFAGMSPARFAALTRQEKQAIVQAAIQALPDATVAHRLGDFVYTYHGIDFSDPDPRLWVVILAPDPDVHGPPAPGDFYCVGSADGSVAAVRFKRMPKLLAEQNAVRAEHGLPPLPDPAKVRHATLPAP
jgi:hypothetical protein